MSETDKKLKQAFAVLGIQHIGLPKGVRGRSRLPWSELDTESLRRIRQIMGPDAPKSLVAELRKRGSSSAA